VQLVHAAIRKMAHLERARTMPELELNLAFSSLGIAAFSICLLVPDVVPLGIHVAHPTTPLPLEAAIVVGITVWELRWTAIAQLLSIIVLWIADSGSKATWTIMTLVLVRIVLGIHVARLATPHPLEATIVVGITVRHIRRTAIAQLLSIIVLWLFVAVVLAWVRLEELEGLIAPGVTILATTRERRRRRPLLKGAREAMPLNLHTLIDRFTLVVVQSSFKIDVSLGVPVPVHPFALVQGFAPQILQTVQVLDSVQSVYCSRLRKKTVVFALMIHNRAHVVGPCTVNEAVFVPTGVRVQKITRMIVLFGSTTTHKLPRCRDAEGSDGADDIRRSAQEIVGKEAPLRETRHMHPRVIENESEPFDRRAEEALQPVEVIPLRGMPGRLGG